MESTLHVHVVDDEREPLCGVCLLATATWGGRSLVPRSTVRSRLGPRAAKINKPTERVSRHQDRANFD